MSAIAGALTGNVTGSTSQFVQAAAVNYLQGLGAAQVKKIADSLDSETARAALHGVVACAGAMAKDASCAAGALGASTGAVINNLLGSVDGLSNEEKEARKNLVTSIVGGIATAVGSGNASAATLAAQLETEQNALGTTVHQFLKGMRSCSDSSSPSCFNDLKEQTEKDRQAFNSILENACSGAGATLLACQEKITAGQLAYPYIGLASLYAKTEEQKEYVKQKLAEQEDDLIAQFPRLEALGAKASLLEHLLVELASTIDNPAGVVSSLNSLRGKVANIRDRHMPGITKPTGASNNAPVLDWTRINPQGQSAIDHVSLHGVNDLKKPKQGVFNGDPIRTTEEAWVKVQQNKIQPVVQANGNLIYDVPMGRPIGWEGGSKGSGAQLTSVRIVTTSKAQVVTSFPK